MKLNDVKKQFFNDYPTNLAYFYHNEKLNKDIAVVFNFFRDGKQKCTIIDDNLVKNIKEYTKSHNSPDSFSSIMMYFFDKLKKDDLSEFFSDCYFEMMQSGITLDSVEDACAYVNEYATKHPSPTIKNISKRSLVNSYIIEEDGSFSTSPISTMDLSAKKTQDGVKVCYIEGSFTEPEYRGVGIQTQTIRFLEAVMATKNIPMIMGEADEYDVYDENNSKKLVDHYIKLGFETKQKANGKIGIYKTVESESILSISKQENDTISTM